jgi:hypothetical protein
MAIEASREFLAAMRAQRKASAASYIIESPGTISPSTPSFIDRVSTVNSIRLAYSRESGDAWSHGRYAQTDLLGSHRAVPIKGFARGGESAQCATKKIVRYHTRCVDQKRSILIISAFFTLANLSTLPPPRGFGDVCHASGMFLALALGHSRPSLAAETFVKGLASRGRAASRPKMWSR